MNDRSPSFLAADSGSFRDHIPTADQKTGKRLWVYPRKPSGSFYQARTWVSWFLLALLFIGPFVRINGNPLLMMNIPERKFSVFGVLFWPQDFYLFALMLVTAFGMMKHSALAGLGMLVLAPIVTVLSAVLARIYCEIMIVLFKMNEALQVIRNR